MIGKGNTMRLMESFSKTYNVLDAEMQKLNYRSLLQVLAK